MTSSSRGVLHLHIQARSARSLLAKGSSPSSLCRKLSLGPSAFVQSTELLLDSLHQWTHLPWWAVVVGTTLVLRVGITLPLAVYQMKLAAKQELLLPRLKELQEATLHDVVARCRRANLPHTEANKIFQKEVPCMTMYVDDHIIIRKGNEGLRPLTPK